MALPVRLTRKAKALLKQLHIGVQRKIKAKLKTLSQNPELGKPLQEALKGLYTLKIGRYRALYTRNHGVMVRYVGHRRDVYDKARELAGSGKSES